MRILPRFLLPSFKTYRQKLRRFLQTITIAQWLLFGEACVLGLALLYLFTGRRLSWLDGFGSRGDWWALVFFLALVIAVHKLSQRFLLPLLERYFSPVKYDEHQILFDLGQEARAAADIDNLFSLIVHRIAEAFQADSVAIFIRDEASGEYRCRVASQLRTDIADLSFDPNAFIVRRLRTLVTPMELGPQELDTWQRAFASAPASLREQRALEIALLERLETRLLLQLKIKDQLVGLLSLGQSRVRHEFTTGDKEMLMSIAGQLAFVIENSRLTERMVAEERLRRELALAAEVQRRLLPVQPPENVAVELAGFCQPARGVGGDYYDFIRFDNQQLGIAIADVAGKGMAAALLMSTVQATLRSLSAGHLQPNDSLADLVATLNRLLCNSTGGANYVTFFYAQFNEVTSELAYVNAGHNPPVFFRAQPTHDFRNLPTGGLFVGMFEHLSYEQETIQMQSGDILVAFTDGLPEALNIEEEEFSEERLREVLARVAHRSVNEIRDAITEAVMGWCADAPQHDDLTFLVMKVK